MQSSFMVTGATGYQGGSLARVLLTQGFKVHALVRDPGSEKAGKLKDLGATIFKGGFDDVDVIKVAMSGVTGVFLNPFPNPMDPDLQVRQAKNIIDVAVTEQCHLYLSSAVFTSHKEKWQSSGPKDFLYLYYSRKFAIEAEVRAASLKSFTIVRPPYLMHNYLIPFSNFHFPELPTKGILKHMYNEGRTFAHLDSADVGKIAAAVLLNPKKYDKLELDIGAQNLDADAAAKSIRKVSGRDDITTEKVVIENFDTETKTGLTWHYLANTQDVALDNRHVVEKLFGVRLTTFEEYLEREKEMLKSSLPLSNWGGRCHLSKSIRCQHKVAKWEDAAEDSL